MVDAEPPSRAGTYVRIALGTESYALSVETVLEVTDLDEVTPLPGAPQAVLGVFNLRGNVLPVVDARALLGSAETGGVPRRIVVTERAGRRVGLAVDAVIGVGPLPGTLEPTDAEHLAGARMVQGELVGLLELDSLLAAVEKSA